MRGFVKAGLILLLVRASCPCAEWQGLRIENLAGSITVRPTPREEASYRTTTPSGQKPACRSEIDEKSAALLVRCEASGPPVQIEVDLPVGMPFAAVTGKGSISFAGLSRLVNLSTDTGDVRISVPWSMMRLNGFSLVKPKSVSAERGIVVRSLDQRNQWLVNAGKGPSANEALLGSFYGEVLFRGASPGRLELTEMAVPEYSWIKPPSDAVAVIEAWRKQAVQDRRPKPGSSKPPPEPQARISGAGMPVFSADVRMVNLSVTVTSPAAQPVAGLKPDEFEVLEGGVPQNPASVKSEDVPFNLVLLLDLSGSTRDHREAMKQVARRFAGIARPQDRLAVYALANGFFYVISRLTTDREDVLEKIGAIPMVEGQTPLYDSIVLSAAEELLRRPEERNALIVITDGVDTALEETKSTGRSMISVAALRTAASEMPVLIYPVLVGLDNLSRYAVPARRNVAQVAEASGGRVFQAASMKDIEPVYAQVAEELRAVYTVAYYPKNQNFDGKWRRVEVRVKHPSAKVRARQGYYAR
jgi:VWFA-related protein